MKGECRFHRRQSKQNQYSKETSMSIEISREQCVSLAKAARRLPCIRGSKPPHPMTLYRWATKGLRSRSGKRIILETTFIGGTRVTSEEALERFFLRKNDVVEADVRSDSQLRFAGRAIAAKEVLQQFGVLDKE
jgi:hypothetical protein